jgi:hypothetical protein
VVGSETGDGEGDNDGRVVNVADDGMGVGGWGNGPLFLGMKEANEILSFFL